MKDSTHEKILEQYFNHELHRSVFKFRFKNQIKDTSIEIVSNLKKVKDLSISDAFANWVVRTDNYTEKDFCNYVLSQKIPNTIVLPKSEFDEIISSKNKIF